MHSERRKGGGAGDVRHGEGTGAMRKLLSLGQMLSVHARLHPDRPGASDLDRAMTFRQWDERR